MERARATDTDRICGRDTNERTNEASLRDASEARRFSIHIKFCFIRIPHSLDVRAKVFVVVDIAAPSRDFPATPRSRIPYRERIIRMNARMCVMRSAGPRTTRTRAAGRDEQNPCVNVDRARSPRAPLALAPFPWPTDSLADVLAFNRSLSETGRGRVTRSDVTRSSTSHVNNMRENSAMTSAVWKEGSPLAFPSPSVAESYSRQEPPTVVDSMGREREMEKEKEVVQIVDCVNMGSTTRAVILAGGEQKNPLTHYRAMPAVSIGSCMMLIDVPINNCLSAGINKMYVLTQFQSHQINSHVASAYPPQGFGPHEWLGGCAHRTADCGGQGMVQGFCRCHP